MTDLHCHIIPYIDDGAKDIETTLHDKIANKESIDILLLLTIFMVE